MKTIKINIGNQPPGVLRVLNEFDKRTRAAYRKNGKLSLMSDGLPLVVISIKKLSPKMPRARRLKLALQVFKIIENMHRLTSEFPPSKAAH